MNAFHVIGSLTAIWAVVVAILGIKSEGFPRGGIEKVVGAVSVVLVTASIAAAVITAETPEEHEGAQTGHGEQEPNSEEESHQETAVEEHDDASE